ncbi:MAG: hypothetical protein NTW25_06645 [Candidatus Kapabacteria bacterium]|nr:hypothetical protein [Candidatus Kapabacteria bacterium]
MKKTIYILVILFAFQIGNSQSERKNNYFCQRCSKIIQFKSEPSHNGCPTPGVNRDFSHRWFNLGIVGVNPYSCSRCRATVYSKSEPSHDGCPTPGVNRDFSHSWIKN